MNYEDDNPTLQQFIHHANWSGLHSLDEDRLVAACVAAFEDGKTDDEFLDFGNRIQHTVSGDLRPKDCPAWTFVCYFSMGIFAGLRRNAA